MKMKMKLCCSRRMPDRSRSRPTSRRTTVPCGTLLDELERAARVPGRSSERDAHEIAKDIDVVFCPATGLENQLGFSCVEHFLNWIATPRLLEKNRHL